MSDPINDLRKLMERWRTEAATLYKRADMPTTRNPDWGLDAWKGQFFVGCADELAALIPPLQEALAQAEQRGYERGYKQSFGDSDPMRTAKLREFMERQRKGGQ